MHIIFLYCCSDTANIDAITANRRLLLAMSQLILENIHTLALNVTKAVLNMCQSATHNGHIVSE